MGFYNTCKALLWRNFVYRKRRWIASIVEFLFPILGVALLLYLKQLAGGTDSLKPEFIPSVIRTNGDVMRPLTFSDWLLQLKVDRKCAAGFLPPFTLEAGTANEWSASSISSDLDHYITGNQYGNANPLMRCNPEACEFNGQDALPLCEKRTVGVVNAPSNFRSYLEGRYGGANVTDGLLPDYEAVFHEFATEDELEDYVTADAYEDNVKVAIAIVFSENFGVESKYEYKLRLNSTNYNNPEQSARPVASTMPWTTISTANYFKDDNECYFGDSGGVAELGPLQDSCFGKYVYNGAITTQRLVQDFILFSATGDDQVYQVAEGGVGYVPFPSVAYTENGFYGQIGPFVPLLIILLLLYQISNTIRVLVSEKEQRQTELLKIMSVSQFQLEFSWITSFMLFYVPSAFIAGAMSTNFWESADPGTLVFFWLILTVVNILFCSSVAAFFSKATRATLVGLLVYFAGYILLFVVDVESSSIGTLSMVCLHPVTAFSTGFVLLGDYEDKGFDIANDDLGYPNGLTFNNVFGFLIFDIFLWSFFSWYFNRTVKGEYGRANPLYFMFLPSYWFPKKFKNSPVVTDEISNEEINDAHIEPVTDQLKAQEKDGKCVSLKKLVKTFKNTDGSEKIAVNQLSLNFYAGQITALLGHNGAGKTTTIHMLTGLLNPTSGDASVMGQSVSTQMPLIRENIGICLQHDCLFDLLTVQEHIEFYSMLKNSYDEDDVKTTMKDVALYEKRYTPSKNLSGGMKRKLSVAIAFCGGSKTVFLDEPTSGMDPFSRRFTWNVIRQYRSDRCIVLTTHFMDEADILGDRIAIMSSGSLRCVGSSLYLKKEYGVGYQITLEKNSSKDNEIISQKAISAVHSHIEEAVVLSNVGSELSFQIPLQCSPKFPAMLRELESMQEDVVNYGVSITTLEEVFLIIAKGENTDKMTMRASSAMAINTEGLVDKSSLVTEDVDVVNLKTDDEAEVVVQADKASTSADSKKRALGEITFQPTYSKHMKALVKKRALNFKRDKKAWFCSVILPALISFLGFIALKFAPDLRNLDALTLVIDDYNEDIDTDSNPLVFNAPDTAFECNPGNCVNMRTWNDTIDTDDAYSVCGIRVDESCRVTNMPTESKVADPAVPFDENVDTIFLSSQFLNQTRADFKASRYGALIFTRDIDSVDVESETLFEPESICRNNSDMFYLRNEDLHCVSQNGIGYVVTYNFTGVHSSLLYTAIADEMILESHSNYSGTQKIEVTLDPLPITAFEEEYSAGEDAFLAWFNLVLSFPFITGAFATFVVKERKTKAKHLQTVAGVTPSAYWFSSFIWDILNYQLTCWAIFLFMIILSIDVFTTTENDVLSATIMSMITFGPAAAGFTYCVSFLFEDDSSCQFFVIILNFMVGMGGPIAGFVLRILDASTDDDQYLRAARIMEWCLRIIPSFSFGHALYFIININFIEVVTQNIGNVSAWDKDVALYDVIVMAIQGLLYPVLAVGIDKGSTNPAIVQKWKCLKYVITFKWLADVVPDSICRKQAGPQIYVEGEETDIDVKEEEDRVLSKENSEDAIVLKKLVKQWNPQKIAVNEMTLGIPVGECFGLLGINGAGKTTTMGILTAEFPPTSGDAWLNGYSVTREPDMIRRSIGYCPQFDAHFMNMTGREHVELYASIKGVPQEQIFSLCSAKLAEVGLSEADADKVSAGYSGGMKRKLSVACASIGEPRIVFLDEPSTGMDPLARRDLWKTILGMVEGGSTSIVLTTHSMEECEALCPRIGIMASGKLKCLGSAQRLKSRFGKGYQVELTVKLHSADDEDYCENIKTILDQPFVEINENSEDVEDDPSASLVGKASSTYLSLENASLALEAITGDSSLSSMLTENDSYGYIIYKEAISDVGVSVSSIGSFATNEVRVKKLISFITDSYSDSILRERQQSKCRFEIMADGDVKVSSIFEIIEDNKDGLKLADYGVSQTSLEQVFNIHAAAAEEEKKGRIEY